MKFSYEITPRPDNLGGGGGLRPLEDGVVVGGGVFPPEEGIKDAIAALQSAFADAEAEAFAWLNTRDGA
jgi:hypothetical protein